MKHASDPNAQLPESLETPQASRRRVLQMLGVAGMAGLPAWSFGQPTASVNTTKLAVTDTEVTIDANPEMAGQTLTFDIEVTDVRAATKEELAHGHVHGPGGHHHG